MTLAKALDALRRDIADKTLAPTVLVTVPIGDVRIAIEAALAERDAGEAARAEARHRELLRELGEARERADMLMAERNAEAAEVMRLGAVIDDEAERTARAVEAAYEDVAKLVDEQAERLHRIEVLAREWSAAIAAQHAACPVGDCDAAHARRTSAAMALREAVDTTEPRRAFCSRESCRTAAGERADVVAAGRDVVARLLALNDDKESHAAYTLGAFLSLVVEGKHEGAHVGAAKGGERG